MTLEELKVIITAETKGLKQELNSLKSQLNKTETQVTKSTKSISSKFSNLTKAVSLTAVVYGLAKFGKAAINAASDLEEVQNVVDVAFGNMADKCNSFAETATAQFGLSAVQAKQFSSTMMSMANGMNVPQEQAANMSIQLAGLAGDLASFRNVSQDVANTALQSVFTGETETLKKFGVVMTETNLSAYALSKGITKGYNEMSQAEKVMLRYSYVMNATKDAQNDYARTSNNWANQVRLLKNQFTTLLSIIGKGFIAVLNPVIQLINKLLAGLIAVANAAAKAFGGKEIKNINSSVKDTSDSVGDISSGYDSATDSAKELKRTLAGFDEINKLTKPETDSTDSTEIDPSIAALSGETYFDYGEQFDSMSTQAEQAASRVSQIFDKYFSNLPKLQINFNKEQAVSDLTSIGENLLSIFAGLGSFVLTIGIEIANDLDIGKLGNDILGLVSRLTELGRVLIDILTPALTDVYEILLSPIVTKLGEILDFLLVKLTEAIETVTKYIEEHADEIKIAIEVITSALLGGIGAWVAYRAAMAIGSIVSSTVSAISLIPTALGVAGLNIYAFLGPVGLAVVAIGALAAVFVLLWNKCEGFREFWKTLGAELWEYFGPSITELKNAFVELWNDVLKPLWEDIKATFTELKKAVKELVKALEPIIKVFIENLKLKIDLIITVIKSVIEIIGAVIKTVMGVLTGIIEFIVGVFTGDWEKAWEGVKQIFSSIFEGLGDIAKAVLNVIIGVVNTVLGSIINGINAAIGILNTINIKIPDWVPILGGKEFGFNITPITWEGIPELANGGVITAPTVAMMGEYAGASQNPEIVAPQSLLQQIIANSNGEVVSAIFAIGNQIAKSVDEKSTDIYMDTTKVTRRITKEQKLQTKQMGSSLVLI